MSQSNAKAKGIVIMLAAVFLIVGIFLLVFYARLNTRIENSRSVSATVVEVLSSRRHNNKRMYTPVYEYSDGGEVKQYTSSVSSTRRTEIGSEVTLYIAGNGDVLERSGASIILFVGIIFVAVGGFFLFAIIKMGDKIQVKIGGSSL